MSFKNIKQKTSLRFSENRMFLNFIKSLEPKDVTDAASNEVNMMKGLFYVHLYSTIEKTFNELIENTLILINSKCVQKNHFNLHFNSISLINKLKSFKDCGYRSFFTKAYELFNEMSNSDIAIISDSTFSKDLQNIWTKTIVETTKTFGMKNFFIDLKTKTTIDEIVDKRNAVAHGRETANIIGQKFRSDDLRSKMDTVIDFIAYLIESFENFYDRKDFLKPSARKYYA